MRLRHHDGTLVHLVYNAGVHPADDLENLIAHLTRYAVPVRRKLGVRRLGLGLWIPPAVAEHLIMDRIELVRLSRILAERGLEVVTLDGLRCGSRQPGARDLDWAKPERYRYTLNLARILSFLLPEDVAQGTITTLPLARRGDWPPALADIAARRLERLAKELRSLATISGRTISVGFEPQPGCVIETTDQAAKQLAGFDPAHLGICLDTRHMAGAGRESLRPLASAGLPVIKVALQDEQCERDTTLATLFGGEVPVTHHLELDLPAARRPRTVTGLVTGLVTELDGTRRRLTQLGLTNVAAA
ncbi:TIM barrel protein [Rhizohabitans arisaemae]|uniref:TIM barrel protein n=1 Tax=Rhizohabitans arisaemae TaxID=2720610 RepID=UPI0024B12B51|nr:TIM barrel protein [Rhizohabitans arisaemae]